MCLTFYHFQVLAMCHSSELLCNLHGHRLSKKTVHSVVIVYMWQCCVSLCACVICVHIPMLNKSTMFYSQLVRGQRTPHLLPYWKQALCFVCDYSDPGTSGGSPSSTSLVSVRALELHSRISCLSLCGLWIFWLRSSVARLRHYVFYACISQILIC